jgi:DNA repair ATPase RecN
MTPALKKSLIIAAAVVVVAAIAFLVFNSLQNKKAIEAQKQANEQLQLQNQQLQLTGEYEQLNTEYKNFESQTQFIKNDSVIQKYNDARNRVQQLLQELKSQKTMSSQRIQQLQNEIKTLKGIMRHYVEIIDSLGRENAGLKVEIQQVRSQNEQLNSQVSEVSQKNENLNKRMTLAEKLNITGLNLTPLKGNGRTEKKITKAKQLMVSFTITENNSTPVGNKSIFVRITNPEGSLLGAHGSFSFEGSNLPFTESRVVEYSGQEVPVTIYWNVNTTLTPGQYTVEVFADNYRLGSRGFSLNK